MKSRKSYTFLFFINIIFAIALLVFYATSFISPKDYPLSGYLNLLTPLPFFINVFFVIYWVFKAKKYVFLSLIMIFMGWNHIFNIFSFSNGNIDSNGIKLMSYNVMQFYSPSDETKNTYEDIERFVLNEQPDILCFQEFATSLDNKFYNYKYRVENDSYEPLKTVILSKYPILNSKMYNFESNNSGIYADIVVKKDTLRVFSVHFESMNIRLQIEEYKRNKKLWLKRFTRVYPRQIVQFEAIKDDVLNSPYPVIIGTDMNNTAISYLYQNMLSLDLKDAFLESGKGYGKTYKIKGVPVRIDFIYASEDLISTNFNNYNVNYSDHYPIMATFNLKP